MKKEIGIRFNPLKAGGALVLASENPSFRSGEVVLSVWREGESPITEPLVMGGSEWVERLQVADHFLIGDLKAIRLVSREGDGWRSEVLG